MDTSIRNITLDFYNNTMITVNAKQGDHKLRGILATISENGVPIVLDFTKVSAYVRCKKPDDTVVFNKCTIDSNGRVYIELTNQILACAGRISLDIIIVELITATTYQKIVSSGANVISTMTMYLNIVENVFPDEYIESKDEFSALKYALARAEYNYENVIKKAETYAKNAKTSSDTAITKADEASVSATNASVSEINAKNYAANASNSESIVAENTILAKSSADAAKTSELLAKQYAETAFDATPDGYALLVNNVDGILKREINATLHGLSTLNNGLANSQVLQNMINTVSALGGGTIYIPAGTYVFSANGSQTIGNHCIKLKSNVRIIGDGNTTVLKPTGHTENGLDMFYYNDYIDFGSITFLENCIFENFVIDGTDTSVSNYTSAGKGFMINLFARCHWRNIIVKNTDATGFGVDCPKDSSIVNCIAEGCGKAAQAEKLSIIVALLFRQDILQQIELTLSDTMEHNMN